MADRKITPNADEVVAKLRAAEDARIDIREFVAQAMREFGGPGGLAREFKLCYDGQAGYNANRVRMLSDLSRLIFQLSGDALDIEETVDVEDLEAITKALLAEGIGS